jgi:hypothetical protein
VALCFGTDVPHLPGRPGLLHGGQHPVGGLRDPVGINLARGFCAGASAVATIDATASELPNTAAASLSQVARCSASDRGSCLASRVCNVACCASCSASTGVGGRPCSAWNWMASSPRRRLIWARRVDHRWFSRGSTPTISRIGRLPGSESGTRGEPHAQRVAEVLLQGGVIDGMRRLRPRSQLDVGCRRLTPCPVVAQVAGGLSE